MRPIILLSVLIIIACNNDKQTETEKIPIPETSFPAPSGHTTDINYRPDSISDRPVSFYLNSDDVSGIAKDFFLGKFKAGDDDSTAELISYITTENSTIRPFYRWCINHIMTISDGALSEHVGDPALDYAIKFPEEFINYINGKEVEGRWISLMAYSSFKFGNQPDVIRREIIKQMKANCSNCSSNTLKAIDRFGDAILKEVSNMI